MDEREYLDDIDEDSDDDVVELFRWLEEMDTGSVYLNNPRELSKMEITEEIIRKTVNSNELEFEGKINEPVVTFGSICAEGRTIKISNPKLFIEVLKLADNIEFYPKTNGNVRMGVAFNSLAVKIGKVE